MSNNHQHTSQSRPRATTMDPSFQELYESGVFGGETSTQATKRPNFLAAIGTMVTRSVKRPLSPRSRSVGDDRASSRPSTSHSRSPSRSQFSLLAPPSPQPPPQVSQGPLLAPPTWKTRGQTPDMDDYLSLSQLESVWHYQDSHVGLVDVPLTSKSYTFQEIAEAPTIVKRKHHNHNPVEYESDTASSEDSVSVDNFHTDDHLVVDGMMHPALRPVAHLDNRGRQRTVPVLPRLQIPNSH